MTRTKWYWPCRMHPKNTVESWKLIKSSCRIDVVQTFCKMSSTCHLLSSVPSHQKSAQVSAVVESKSPNRTIQAHIIGNVCVVVEGIPVFWNFIPIYIYIVHYFVKLQLLRFRALQATEGVVEWFRLQSVQHMGRSITTALSEWGHERPEKKELFKYVQMRKLGHQGFDSSPTYPHHNIAKFNPILCEVFWLGPNTPTEQSISMKQIATCFVSMRWSMQKYSVFATWRKNKHPSTPAISESKTIYRDVFFNM